MRKKKNTQSHPPNKHAGTCICVYTHRYTNISLDIKRAATNTRYKTKDRVLSVCVCVSVCLVGVRLCECV